MEIRGDLIHKFEATAFAEDDKPIPANELLRTLMDSQGIKQSDLAKELDVAPSRLSEFLSGKRKITFTLARKLADRFALSLEALMQDAEQDAQLMVKESAPRYEPEVATTDMNSSANVTVSFQWKREAVENIKAIAEQMGDSFESYVKQAAYRAAMEDRARQTQSPESKSP